MNDHDAETIADQHEWDPATCDSHCQHIDIDFGTEDDGHPAALISVNGQVVLRTDSPPAMDEISTLLHRGAIELAVHHLAFQEQMPLDQARIMAEVMMATGAKVFPINLDQSPEVIVDKIAQAMAEALGDRDGEVETMTDHPAHCDDCGHWLDSKGMCPSCLPNSQRNADERTFDE